MSARENRWARRQQIATELATRYGGVARRSDLVAAGLSRAEIQTEVARGVWHRAGWHTVCVEGTSPQGVGLLWRALWESGSRSVLDGPTALLACGLTGWTEELIHVSVPRNATIRQVDGVRHHVLRDLGPRTTTGLRRTRPAVAVVRAAQWARTDREAASLIAMVMQQRLLSQQHLLDRWAQVHHCQRREFLDLVIRDVSDGAQSINELDVSDACRAHGLPRPSRQAVRHGSRGRLYLDLYWDEELVHVEVHGAHHYAGLRVIEDSVRQNDLTIAHPLSISLQIPVLGWRLSPELFLAQIAAALQEGRRRQGLPPLSIPA